MAGTLTTKMAGPLVRLWEQMPEPKWCVAMGTCTTSGGRFKRSYSVVQGVDRVMPVDVYVPGCPPRPEGLIYGHAQAAASWSCSGAASGGPTSTAARSGWPGKETSADRPGQGGRAGAPAHRSPGRRSRGSCGPTRTPSRSRSRANESSSTLRTLRDDPDFGFFYLADAAAVDYGVGRHFEVVYHLYSDRHPAWLRVRVPVDRSDPRSPSVTGVWPGAMFHEREMYDMMGIVFEGNRDLRRIYMSPEYRSFPSARTSCCPTTPPTPPAAGREPAGTPGDLGPELLHPRADQDGGDLRSSRARRGDLRPETMRRPMTAADETRPR